MESDPLLAESPASFNSSSYDSATSIQKRDEIITSLQEKIKQLLKVKKRNEKLDKCIKALKEKYKSQIELINGQLSQITSTLGLPPNSSFDSIIDQINNLKQSDNMLQAVRDNFGFQISDKNTLLQQLKEEKQKSNSNEFFVSNISKILGDEITQNNLLSTIQDLQNAKTDLNSTLNALHLKDLNELVQKQKQLNSFLGFDQIQSQDDLLTKISSLQQDHNEVIKSVSSILPPEFKYRNPQQIREAILQLKNSNDQNQNNLTTTEKQLAALKSEIKRDQDLLSQHQCSSMDELSSVINDISKTINASSLKMIKPEIVKLFAEKEKLETMNNSITKELDNTKSQFNETNAQLTIKIDEVKNMKKKIDDLDLQRIQNENEKNKYKAMIPDKDEEINSLKALLQSNKGSVQKTFDEMNEQILALKSKIRKLTEANEELSTKILDVESKNTQLTFEVNSLNEDNQAMKQSLKENLDTKNEWLTTKSELEKEQKDLKGQFEAILQDKEQLEKKNSDISSEMETIKSLNKELANEKEGLKKKLTKIEQEFLELNEEKQNLETVKSDLQSQKEQLNDKIKQVTKLLNLTESDNIGNSINKLLNENKQLKQTNKDQNDNLSELNNEKDQIFSLLNITDENCMIYDAISDLLDNQKELAAENKDLSQKMSTIANFLNIDNPQSATFPMIQKTIRNLQKQIETSQKDHETLSQKYQKLKEIQDKLQQSIDTNNNDDLIQTVSTNEHIISQAMEKMKVNNKSDLIDHINQNEEIITKLSEELNTDRNNLVKLIQKQKNESTQLATLLNTSEEMVQKTIEDNLAFVQKASELLNRDKESCLNQIQLQTQVIKQISQILNTEQLDQIPSELTKLLKEKSESDKLFKELTSMMNLQESDDYSALKPALQNILNQNNHIVSIQKVLSDQGNISELSTIIQNSQDQLKQIQSIFGTDDVVSTANSMKDTLNQIRSILNLDQTADPIQELKSTVQLANSVKALLEEENGSEEMNNSTMINLLKKKLDDQKNIEHLLNNSSPFEAIQNALDEKEKGIQEITEQNSSLKNELKRILGINNSSEILQTVQNDAETKNELFEIFGVQNANELIGKAKELSTLEQTLKTLYPNEKSSQKALQKLTNERKEICQSLNCNDQSMLDEVKKLQNGMKNLNDAYNSGIDMTPDNLVQSAKSTKQLFKKLMKTFGSKSFDEIDEKVHLLKKENDEITSLLNANDDSPVNLISSMLNTLNASSYSDFITKINSFKDQVKKLSHQHDCDHSFMKEFMTDSEIQQVKNGDQLHFILNKLNKQIENQKKLIEQKDSENIHKEKLLEQKDYELTEILKLLNVSSPQFGIEVIQDLKKQIMELEKEVCDLKGCRAVEESLKAFEAKEKRFFSLISTKLTEISNLLNTFLSSAHASKGQKNEMKSLIEKALIESQTLREMIMSSDEKWALFGGKKKIPTVPTPTSETIRIKQKEIKDVRRKAAKAEQTSTIQYMRENPNSTLI